MKLFSASPLEPLVNCLDEEALPVCFGKWLKKRKWITVTVEQMSQLLFVLLSTHKHQQSVVKFYPRKDHLLRPMCPSATLTPPWFCLTAGWIKLLTSSPVVCFFQFTNNLPDIIFNYSSFLLLLNRHVFFMHVKEDLHNGHLRMGSEQAEELSALLAQAEFGDYNQNTAQYWYSELCGEEPSAATIDRYDPLTRTVNSALQHLADYWPFLCDSDLLRLCPLTTSVGGRSPQRHDGK